MNPSIHLADIENLERRIAPAALVGMPIDLKAAGDLKIIGAAQGDFAGYTLSSAGDVNGDGFDDALIGVFRTDVNGATGGAAFVVFGSPSGPGKIDLGALDGTDGFRIDGLPIGDGLGISVSAAGDVNGDGFADILLGASSSYGGQPRVYVMFGTDAAQEAQFNVASLDGSNGFQFQGAGRFATGAGDINGDEFDDIAVAGGGGNGAGRGTVSVLFGKQTAFDSTIDASGLDGTDGFRLVAPYSFYAFASSLSSAGDNNGDGFGDLLIGNPDVVKSADSRTGGAIVLLGSAVPSAGQVFLQDLDASRLLNFTGDSNAGGGVAGLGDFNGDGLDDLVIGVPKVGGYGSTKTRGTVYVVHGQPTLAIGDASVVEGNRGSEALDFPVTLSSPLDHKLKVVVSINGGTATPAIDFGGTLQQTLKFAPGETSKVVSIPIVGDEVFEPDETITVKITAKSPDVFAGRANAIGSIFDDDVAPGVIRLQHLSSDDGMIIPDEPGTRIGDFNGDGWNDFAVGEPESSVNGPRSGAVYVVFGTAAGYPLGLDLSTLDGANGFRVLGQLANESVGLVIANIGDMNGDGLADLSIGASYARFGNPAYVIFGTSGAVAADFDVTTLDGVNGFQITGLGGGLARIGDFNGDGIADFIGRALTDTLPVIFGSDHAFPAVWDVSSLDGTNGFRFKLNEDPDFGVALDSAGDVNGDGFDDIILGVELADEGGRASGAAYVLFGRGSGLPAELSVADLDGANGFTLTGAKSGDRAGRSVSGLGDVNGDGFDDVIVGAPYAGGFEDTVGKNYVVFGRGGTFSPSVSLGSLDGTNGFFLKGEASGDLVTRAGDVNGDGLADFLILAPGAEVAMHDGFTSIQHGIDGGSAYVVYGSRAGFPKGAMLDSLLPMQRLRIDGFAGATGFLNSVTSAGDVNGDGFDDVLVDASDYTGASNRIVIYGSPAVQLENRKVMFTDVDGDSVIVKTSTGSLKRSDFHFLKTDDGVMLGKLDLTNHSDLAGGTLTVKAKASATGDGRATIGTIDVTGLNLANVNLKGVSGTVVGGSSSGSGSVSSSGTFMVMSVLEVELIDSIAEFNAPTTVTEIMAAADEALIARIANVVFAQNSNPNAAADDRVRIATDGPDPIKLAEA